MEGRWIDDFGFDLQTESSGLDGLCKSAQMFGFRRHSSGKRAVAQGERDSTRIDVVRYPFVWTECTGREENLKSEYTTDRSAPSYDHN